MAKDDPKDPKVKPGVVHGSTHVTIAFPFSAIKSEQPSTELADFRPSPPTKALAERAQELAAKLEK